MSPQGDPRTDLVDLRKRAEKLAGPSPSPETMAPEETARLLEELRVHQIELQMQNEELRRAQVDLDTARARYFDLFDLAPVGYFAISDRGVILEANLTAARLLGVERGVLGKRHLASFLAPDDADTYYRRFKQLIETGIQQVFEIRLLRPDGAHFWARVEAGTAEGCEFAHHYRVVIGDITERKRAEEELRQREAELDLIYHNVPFIMLLLDENCRIRKANKFAEQFAGTPEASLIGKYDGEGLRCLYALEHPDGCGSGPHCRTCTMRLAVLDTIATGNSHHQVEASLPIACPENFRQATFLLSTVEFKLWGERRVLATIQDITARKQMEEALRSSEATLSKAQGIAHLANWELDLKKNIVRGSLELYRLFELTRDLSLVSYIEKIHPEDRQKVVASIHATIQEGKPFSIDYRIIPSAGVVRHVHAEGELARDQDGRPVTFFGTVQDITEREQALEAMRQLSAIVESSDDAIIGETLEGTVTSWNLGAARLYGYPAAEMIGQSTSALYPADDHDEGPRILRKIAEGGRIEQYETIRIRKDGSRVDVMLKVSPIFDGLRNIVGASAIARDNTERKRIEAALIRSEKLASVGRMAASISHEINNPLAAVMNVLYLAANDKDLPESVHEYLKIAESELKRVTHITRQALGFYRELTLPELTRVSSVFESAVDLLHSRIEAKHAVIKKQWDANLQITAVPGELRQVLSNLIVNSLEAIEAKGVIQLRVSPGASFGNGRRRVRITVADNGKGMNAATCKRLFEPFFTTKGAIGTGLGLWVSKQIIEKHGGSIRMRSRTHGEQKGTTFSVLLPIEAASLSR